MVSARLLSSCGLALAIASCAPSDQGEDKRAPGLPGGYELAVAQPGAEREATSPRVVDITAEQLKAKLASGAIRLIDVRTDEEFAEGMIEGADHIALDRLDPASLDLSDGREIVLYCRSGRRSGIAGEALSAHTREPVQHLAGGILAWQEAGEPVTVP